MSVALAIDEPFVDPICKRCQCCTMDWFDCDNCGGDGYTQPGELYEEDPLWYDEDDVEACNWCYGKGGGWWCSCDEDGLHESHYARLELERLYTDFGGEA